MPSSLISMESSVLTVWPRQCGTHYINGFQYTIPSSLYHEAFNDFDLNMLVLVTYWSILTLVAYRMHWLWLIFSQCSLRLEIHTLLSRLWALIINYNTICDHASIAVPLAVDSCNGPPMQSGSGGLKPVRVDEMWVTLTVTEEDNWLKTLCIDALVDLLFDK